jgi:hypothetical protein
MAFEKEMQEFALRREQALKMGGAEKITHHHAKGKWTARERIERLLDPDSFLEVGRFNHSDIPGMEEKTPDEKKGKSSRPQRDTAFRSSISARPRGSQGHEFLECPGAFDRSPHFRHYSKI